MKLHEWTVRVVDLESLRDGLESALTHLKAVDIANASKNLAPETHYSPLTVEVDNMLLAVIGYIEEVAIAEYEGERGVKEIDLTTDDEEDDGLAEDE